MIPNFFYKTTLIGEIENTDLQNAIKHVHEPSTKKEALEKAFELITNRYKGYRFFTYLFFWKIFEINPNILWQQTGFMHCTQQNFLLRILLVKSGWFTEEDIKFGYSLVWYISPHQYLKVNLNNHIVAVDPWNHRFGVPLGKYAAGFGYKSFLL